MHDMEPREHTAVHLDRGQIRALAHPVRMRLVGLLRRAGPATATGLAGRLGTNSGQTSYHLRQLAEVGLVVEEAGRGTARERWWRAAHTTSTWSSVEAADDPEARAADEWIMGFLARELGARLQHWLDVRTEWPAEWIHASELSDFRLRLTPERLTALTRELHAVLGRYRETQEPPGEIRAEEVTLLLQAFPDPEPQR